MYKWYCVINSTNHCYSMDWTNVQLTPRNMETVSMEISIFNSTEITGNDQFNKEASRFQQFQCNHKEILFNLTTQHIQCDRWPRTDRGHLELLPSLILLSFVLQHQTAEEAQ